MKNVKVVWAKKSNTNFYYLNHQLKNIAPPQGVEILLSSEAYKKYKWARDYFSCKPREGYFIWVKEQPKSTLTTCVGISRKKLSQNMANLLVIEPNISVSSNVVCAAFTAGLCARHYAQGKIVIRNNSSLAYEHLHKWGQKDYVEPDYEFYLGKNTKLEYRYQLFNSPEKLSFKTKFHLEDSASAKIESAIYGVKSQIDINEEMELNGKNSQGAMYLKLVAGNKTTISAISRIVANNEVKGHLDCRGLLLNKSSKIRLSPELINKNDKSSLTHEAYIGKINDDEINYLRSRGLKYREALGLIINGFIKV